MPKARTLSSQSWARSGRPVAGWVDLDGQQQLHWVSCAIQMPNQAIAKNVIQRAGTFRVGSVKGVKRGWAGLRRRSVAHGSQA